MTDKTSIQEQVKISAPPLRLLADLDRIAECCEAGLSEPYDAEHIWAAAAYIRMQANGTRGADALDAARYRWLRDGHQKGFVRKTRRPDDAPYVVNTKLSVLYGVVAYSGGSMDAAIDEDRLNDLAQHIYEEALIEGDARFADPQFRFSDEFAEECLGKARAAQGKDSSHE